MNRETQRHKTRLLNVAKALRESAEPDAFDMMTYCHNNVVVPGLGYRPRKGGFECGTPACALGHYAARKDLQNTFKIDAGKDQTHDAPGIVYKPSGYLVAYGASEVTNHFGITFEEADRLFSSTGCGNAKTVKQAARFIEKFVKEKFQ